MTGWEKAVRKIHTTHGCSLVHVPTGNLVTRKKNRLYLDMFEVLEEAEERGYMTPGEMEIADKVARSDCVLVDAVTANMLTTILNALTDPKNKEKFTTMTITQAVDIGWRLVK